MNNMKKFAEHHKDEYPNLPSYMECQSRAFMYGLATFTLSFAVTYFAQELNKKRLPYPSKYIIFPAVAIASVASWTMTRRRTRDCQLMWMAAEGKHTALNPIGQPSSSSTPISRTTSKTV
ncbi:hypothetical protein BV898_01027 [Hypsibius exemplaris]|uniref:Transmembrane protein 141 n=1 Tax=Hypsibius exemplaris TaxID=2072580 RepID=A0A1W0XD73_HYPEX|nr:hypothetical protein BV898_01027 [Hypsibius exemplaris]